MKLTKEQKETFTNFILQVSKFNAAEGKQWAKERDKRIEFTKKMLSTYKKWHDEGLSYNDLLDYYLSTDRHLTSVIDIGIMHMLSIEQAKEIRK